MKSIAAKFRRSLALPRHSLVRGELGLNRLQLQDGVPVPGRASDTKFSFDKGIGDARPTDTGRVHDVSLAASDANNFRACYGSLHLLRFFRRGGALQEYNNQMRR